MRLRNGLGVPGPGCHRRGAFSQPGHGRPRHRSAARAGRSQRRPIRRASSGPGLRPCGRRSPTGDRASGDPRTSRPSTGASRLGPARPRRRGSLNDAVAGLAAQPGSDMANHLEAGPHVLQYLGVVLAERPQLAAAIWAVESGCMYIWISRGSRGRCSGSGRRNGLVLTRDPTGRTACVSSTAHAASIFSSRNSSWLTWRKTFSLRAPKSLRWNYRAAASSGLPRRSAKPTPHAALAAAPWRLRSRAIRGPKARQRT